MQRRMMPIPGDTQVAAVRSRVIDNLVCAVASAHQFSKYNSLWTVMRQLRKREASGVATPMRSAMPKEPLT